MRPAQRERSGVRPWWALALAVVLVAGPALPAAEAASGPGPLAAGLAGSGTGSQPPAAGAPPVVLVHGLHSTAEVWRHYLGADGFLAGIGRRGFAVGDGQVPGEMDTGRRADPLRRTNTIAENAEVLRDYLAGVRELTGADEVDQVAHSMGGLIARYYVSHLMVDRDVRQLIMVGTPNAGSAFPVAEVHDEAAPRMLVVMVWVLVVAVAAVAALVAVRRWRSRRG